MTSDLHHLAAAYAVDALDAEERRKFEAHYPTCEICAAEVRDFRETAGQLAAAAATDAPEGLRDRVLGEITRTAQLAPPVTPLVAEVADTAARPPRSRLALAAAAVVTLLVGTLVGLRLGGDDGTSTDEIVAAPDAVISTLEPAAGIDGTLRVVWSPERDQVAIVGSGLAPSADGQAYALWWLQDGGVAPAALFDVGDDGDVSLVLDVDDTTANGWGITIEPDAGSPQPTTPVIFAGEA